jgi:MscS family membrane protein
MATAAVLVVAGIAGCASAAPPGGDATAGAPAAPAAPAVMVLAPLDMSSPRATLGGFIATVDRVYADLRQNGRGAHRRPVNRHRVRQVLGCLDLGSVPPSLVQSEGIDAVVALKEVLDRVPLPPAAEVPDAAAAAAGPIKRWRLPGTEIVLERIATGPREGDYVFSADTVERAEYFYDRVRGLPYRPDAGSPGLHDLYVESGGWMIPDAVIARLPAWAHTRVLGETVWQWLAAVVVAAAACGALVCAWRCAGGHGERPQPGSATSLVFPAALVAVGVGVDYLLSMQIRLTGDCLRAATIGLRFVTLAGVVAAVVVVMEWLADLVIRLRGPRAEGIESQLVRLGGKLGTFLAVAWIVIEAADSIGIPVAPLVAGLGAGGLAVALASQYTLENLIAGLVLFADKPMRIGDDCQFGGVRGRIEQIGLRSTRIRGADRTVISIPNADLAKQQVVNYTARDHIPLEVTLEVESRLPPRLVRGLLARMEKLLLAHPRLANRPVTARLAAQSSAGYTVRAAAIALTSDEQEFQEIREDVLLALLEEIRAADETTPRARAA